MRNRLLVLLAAVIAVVSLAGCGGNTPDRPDERATLVLDFQPNAVHAGIYSALARDYDEAEGVKLRVREPSASADGIKLLLADRAQFAVVDIHDLAIARAQGRDLVAVLALVQRPLASVIAQPGIRTPAALAGRRAGVTGLPSDDAVLRSTVEGAGGDPNDVRTVTIGFNAVASLLARRVDAATAFWNVEGVALQRQRPGFRVFRVDEFGAPAYPELVLTVTRETLEQRPALVRATIDALTRGYDFTLSDPQSSAQDLIDRVHDLDPELVRAELNAVEPVFVDGAKRFGELDLARLRRWASWEARFGIVERPPDIAKTFGGPAVNP